jgi:hypothetical protein
VPSMTSYAWQTGNVYGDFTEPQYAALSYTWGRFMLRNPTLYQKLSIRPLPVRGIDWEVPLIDSRHFSTRQFKKCIQSCTRLPRKQGQDGSQITDLEWVWVDVACIDQRQLSPEKASEVGRQAAIFRNATSTFVWINTHNSDNLTALVTQLSDVSLTATLRSTFAWGKHPRFLDPSEKGPWLEEVAQRERFRQSKGLDSGLEASFQGPNPELYFVAEDEEWLVSMVHCLRRLFGSSDAKRSGSWFTSMWTLQEAFLCPRAPLLSRDGEVVYINHSSIVDIWSLCIICGVFRLLCLEDVRSRRTLNLPGNKNSLELLKLIDQSGLAALHLCNPMALYTIAKHRRSTRDEDRVYGIQQVFEMKLGKSAQGADLSKTWSLEELELQLCTDLLHKFPVQSQICVHTEEMPLGHAWKVTACSMLPMLARDLSYDFKGAVTGGPPQLHASLCTSLVDGTTWAGFSGKVIDFADMQQAWLTMDRLLGASQRLDSPTPGAVAPQASPPESSQAEPPADRWSIHQVALDAGRIALPPFFDRTDTPRGKPQRDLAAAIVERDEQLVRSSSETSPLQVMLLGEFCYNKYQVYPGRRTRANEPRKGHTIMVGVLLRLIQDRDCRRWARLGVCTWDISDVDEQSGLENIPADVGATLLAGVHEPEGHVNNESLTGGVTGLESCNVATKGGWRLTKGLIG